jgi:hypothetical protein
MITITISGNGAEVTQGKLPATVIDEIYDNLSTTTPSKEELAEYLLEANLRGSHFSWFDIDDVFHSYGPYLNDASISVYLNSEKILTKDCKSLSIDETETVEAEPFVGNLMLDAYGVLTCEDTYKGKFFSFQFDQEKDFDIKNLKLIVETLGACSIITGIRYKNKSYFANDNESVTAQDFYARLEE